jgi:GH24 family phage-related lysozyme (muramidase)
MSMNRSETNRFKNPLGYAHERLVNHIQENPVIYSLAAIFALHSLAFFNFNDKKSLYNPTPKTTSLAAKSNQRTTPPILDPSIMGENGFCHEEMLRIEQRIFDSLYAKSGFKQKVYRCRTSGLPIVGIGHRVGSEENLSVGDTITVDEVYELYNKDKNIALDAAMEQLGNIKTSNPDILINSYFFVALTIVNFQLGAYWTNEHVKTWALIQQGDFSGAAEEVLRSKWAQQTSGRAIEFIDALKALGKLNAPKSQLTETIPVSNSSPTATTTPTTPPSP